MSLFRIAVRVASPGDLDALTDLDARAFGRDAMRESMAAELSRSWARVLVAEAPQTSSGAPSIVAFVTYWIVADEIHVLAVATDPAHRRCGVARKLIAALLADACERGSRTVLLEVRAGNDAAIGLYRAMGFVESGTRSRYYDDGEDARLMQRSLEPEPERET